MASITDSEVILIVSRSQNVVYFHLSMLALLVYDWLILLDREVEDIWRSDWSIAKVLFIVSRYGPFVDIPIMMATHFVPRSGMGYETCSTLYKIIIWSAFLGISISECILLLRTNALYARSKRVMIPLSVIYATTTVVGIVVTWYLLRAAPPVLPPITFPRGCNLVRRDGVLLFSLLVLLFWELAIVILTVRRGFSDFHSAGTPLLKVLYRDSVSFFLVLFALTLSTILVLSLAPLQYRTLMVASARVVHSIICCRILLNIRRAAASRYTPITLSAGMTFASAPAQQTNQAETIHLGLYSMQSDEDQGSGPQAAHGVLSQDGQHSVRVGEAV